MLISMAHLLQILRTSQNPCLEEDPLETGSFPRLSTSRSEDQLMAFMKSLSRELRWPLYRNFKLSWGSKVSPSRFHGLSRLLPITCHWCHTMYTNIEQEISSKQNLYSITLYKSAAGGWSQNKPFSVWCMKRQNTEHHFAGAMSWVLLTLT